MCITDAWLKFGVRGVPAELAPGCTKGCVCRKHWGHVVGDTFLGTHCWGHIVGDKTGTGSTALACREGGWVDNDAFRCCRVRVEVFAPTLALGRVFGGVAGI